MIDRAAITETERVIRPFIRRTPVIEIDGADCGQTGVRIVLKLEHLQYSGSFKARGAFANLLLRQVPDVGVAAASGAITVRRWLMRQCGRKCRLAFSCLKSRLRPKPRASMITV